MSGCAWLSVFAGGPATCASLGLALAVRLLQRGFHFYTMKPVHNLTSPQVKLLLNLRHRPRRLAAYFRPLKPLIDQELARPRALRGFGSNYTYELTTKGETLAQQILEAAAEEENAKA